MYAAKLSRNSGFVDAVSKYYPEKIDSTIIV
jgi:hypothetical protein